MFLGKNLFREYYSLGIKFREQVFLGIFFEGVFLPLAQNSGAFFSYRGKKKSRLCAIAQNSLPLTSIVPMFENSAVADDLHPSYAEVVRRDGVFNSPEKRDVEMGVNLQLILTVGLTYGRVG